jgi:hypothetical protein
VTADDPAVVGALDRARRAWPAAAPVATLLGDGSPAARAAVCEALLGCYAADLVQLHVTPPRLAPQPGPRPEASPLARLQAAAGADVTSLRHTTVRLDDEAGRRLLTLLDGSRDRAALAAAMRAHLAAAGAGDPGDVEAALDRGLERAAELGLLVA